ncbi:MAG: NADH-quinone oxidoreductase subunit L [Candidatus Riflebacteria bacterium]|nr:NADH-quinone oxidoreductase subunit L [Candidatus Riflebacteria bacterium]
MSSTLLLAAVLVPVLGSPVLPLIGSYSERARNLSALVLVLISLAASTALLPVIRTGENVFTGSVLSLGPTIFHADMLAVFMAIVSIIVGAIIVFYSFGYIQSFDHRDEYYFVVVLFLGAMMGLIYANNLIILYLFWEITAFACWRLIGFFREDKQVLKANKAFLITMFGSLVMLIGFLMIYSQTGTFDLNLIKEQLKNTPVSNGAVILILFGILSKSATLPFHTWLPDAGVAPSPVTALLHAAVLVKIGVYVFARLFVATMSIDPIWHTFVPWIAGVSSMVSAGAALLENDMKRIIAYSTISQLGFIFLGLSIGNEIGIVGGLLYILMHSLAKGGLFLCAGIVEHGTHTKDITKMGGLASSMPVTTGAFLVCALSVMGIPPFGGFFSKFLVLAGAVKSNQYALAAVFFIGAVFTMLYLTRLFVMIFLGEARGQSAHEGTPEMVVSVALLGILSLAGGLFVHIPLNYLHATTRMLLGGS